MNTSINQEIAIPYKSMKKLSLRIALHASVLRNDVQDETILRLEREAEIRTRSHTDYIQNLQNTLRQKDKSLKQAINMIKAATHSW